MPTKLAADILKYSDNALKFQTAAETLNALDDIVREHCHIRVLGAMLMPVVYGDTEGIELGKTAFLHRSVPKGWWDEYMMLSARAPAPSAALARLAIAPYTMTEVTQMLEPLGEDRSAFDIHAKYGIRDALGCPIAGRWLFAYWSRRVIKLEPDKRALLFLAAMFATLNLQRFVQPSAERVPKGSTLTARELSVLRALSLGERPAGIAKSLGLGEETVRSHIKKAQTKLGATTLVSAVSRAIRLRLIP